MNIIIFLLFVKIITTMIDVIGPLYGIYVNRKTNRLLFQPTPKTQPDPKHQQLDDARYLRLTDMSLHITWVAFATNATGTTNTNSFVITKVQCWKDVQP